MAFSPDDGVAGVLGVAWDLLPDGIEGVPGALWGLYGDAVGRVKNPRQRSVYARLPSGRSPGCCPVDLEMRYRIWDGQGLAGHRQGNGYRMDGRGDIGLWRYGYGMGV